jgi:hypothetical protein
MLDGALQGADAIRDVIGGVSELYDRQDFNFAGPFGDSCTSSPSTPTGKRSTSQPTTAP